MTSKLLKRYRESGFSPEVDGEVSANAADELEARLARGIQWHDLLQRFNPFHRSQAPDSSSHELKGVIIHHLNPSSSVQKAYGNELGDANKEEVSVRTRATEIIVQIKVLTSISSRLWLMLMVQRPYSKLQDNLP